MKYAFVLATIIAGFSFKASAAANKVCFGMDEARGSRFQAYVTLNNLTISSASGPDAEWLAGTYSYKNDIDGQDGQTYLLFEGLEAQEGVASLVVAQDLHNVGAEGQIKMRLRGEGFMQMKFFCRDNN